MNQTNGDGPTEGGTEGWMDGRTEGGMDGWDGRMHESLNCGIDA